MTNDIQDIFENIQPADFFQSTATHVNVGDDLFNRFTQASLHGVAMAFAANAGELPYPTIALADGEQVWYLTSPGGTVGQIRDYIRQEADALGATMFFFAIETFVGTVDDKSMSSTNDAATMKQLKEDGLRGIYFYAGQRGGSHLQGTRKKIGDSLGPIMWGAQDQPDAVFDQVFA